MAKIERRERMALDRAYEVYRKAIQADVPSDLYSVVEALKTVQNAIDACRRGHTKLTGRLWRKIQQALYDRLITGFPSYVVVHQEGGKLLEARKPLPQRGFLELHPEGLKRNDDFFRIDFTDLHELTLSKLSKVLQESGPSIRTEDFLALSVECTDACPLPPTVVFGHERLYQEAIEARRQAYHEWWDLYWRAYCTPDPQERTSVQQAMVSLESVWGRLSDRKE